MKYRKEIDGLRALAVLPVILFHAGFTAFSGGFVGVDIFFVISGYLITTIIVDEMEKGSFSLLNFYERRARRILPALFFVMLCTLPFAWLWMLPQDLKGFSQSLVAVPLFVSNVLFYLSSGYFDTASELKPLLHTWSLAVEEQYYVLFPLFLMLTWKLGKKWIIFILLAVAVASVITAQWGSLTRPSFAFFLLPTRGFEILIGALISLHINHDLKMASVSRSGSQSNIRSVSQFASITGLILILYAIFTFDKNTPSPGLYTLIPTIGAGLILAFSSNENLVGKLLGSKVLVAIGLISYSAYLWHQPLFAFAKLRTYDELSFINIILLVLSSLLFGYASWKYIENPFRNKNSIKIKTISIFGILLTVLFIVIGFFDYFKNGFPSRVSEQVRVLINNPQEPMSNNLCLEKYPQFKKFNACLLSKNTSPEVFIFGDSHSQHYFKSMSSALSNKSVMNLAVWSCFPFSSEKHYSVKNCENNINTALKFITETNSIKVVVLSGYWGYLSSGGFEIENQNYKQPNALTKRQSESFVQAGIRVLDALGKSEKRIIFMRDTPDLDFNIQSCFDMTPFKRNNIRQDCFMSYTGYLNRYQEFDSLLLSLTDKYPALEIYSPTKLFCSNKTNTCRAKENADPLYYNSDHLTLKGSDLVIQDMLKQYPVN